MIGAPVDERRGAFRLWAWWERAASGWFHVVVLGLVAFWLYLLPFDATDLCYLLSLEDHAWVTQEVVHPLWVPLLWAYRFVLRGLGWHGFVLVPIEAANVLVTAATLLLTFRLARRRTQDGLVAAAAALLLAACPAFCTAGMRPTPYAPAFLCVFASALLLAGTRRPSVLHCAAAGVLAGLAMGLHASAMALGAAAALSQAFDPERRSWAAALGRIAAYGAAMVATAAAAWTAWTLFNGLDVSFYRIGHLRSLFAGVEQVPGTSIYSSGSWWRQLTGLWRSLGAGGPILLPGLVAVALEGRRALRKDAAPEDVRLLVVSVAVLGAVGGFFFINNNRNGFIYASIALLPLLLARAASRETWARRALGLAPVLAVPLAVSAALGGMHRFRDPLPAEIRAIETTLGPRAVLLTPGCPFSELRLLSRVPVFRVQLSGDSAHGCPFPLAEPGEVLRSRIRAWQDQGVAAYFAYGDEERDFSGDANGAEKEIQLFWSAELNAKERAPKLQAVRAALASSGIQLDRPFVSPHGARYSRMIPEGPAGSPPVGIDTQPRDPDVHTDPMSDVARAVVERFHAFVGADPWAVCDPLCLGLTRSSPPESHVACSCSDVPDSMDPAPPGREYDESQPCHFGAGFQSTAAHAYVVAWAERTGLGTPADWSVHIDDQRAEVLLKVPTGVVRLRWALANSCEPRLVEVTSEGIAASAIPSADAAQDFAAHLPVPHVRTW